MRNWERKKKTEALEFGIETRRRPIRRDYAAASDGEVGKKTSDQQPATSDQTPETRGENPVKPAKPDSSESNHRKKALDTALRILTRRDHSKYELVQKLKRRGFSREHIDDAVAFCERFDYTNDDRTVQVYIRQLKHKGYGKKRIQLELKKKGFRRSHIQDILDQSVSETDEREGAERILKKHIKRFEREKDALKRRAKIARFLHAKGFSPVIIAEMVDKYR